MELKLPLLLLWLATPSRVLLLLGNIFIAQAKSLEIVVNMTYYRDTALDKTSVLSSPHSGPS